MDCRVKPGNDEVSKRHVRLEEPWKGTDGRQPSCEPHHGPV